MDTILTAAAPGSRWDHRTLTFDLQNNLDLAIRARDTALAKAEEDREKFISMEAKMKEMVGIEEVIKRLAALEDRSK